MKFNFIDKIFNKFRKVYLPPASQFVILRSDFYQEIKVKIKESWKLSKGEGIRIAVLDTGIDYKHPDLVKSIENCFDLTTDGDPYDYNGHGTHVAGIIAANNPEKIIGLAPSSKIVSIKVLNNRGVGSIEWIIMGIKKAIEEKVDLINLSLGSKTDSPLLHEIIKEAFKRNIAIICAAGNDGNISNFTTGFPANYPETISVGSIDPNLLRSNFSSIGKVDIVAPGKEIYSTYPNGKYTMLSGTSMATPMVTGISALILSAHRLAEKNQQKLNSPISTPSDLLNHLKKIAIDLGHQGFDREFGWGLIDPEKICTVLKHNN